MNATILHESRGRIRVRLQQRRMTLEQADQLEAWLQSRGWAKRITVHERTCSVIAYYSGDRQTVLDDIRRFSWERCRKECEFASSQQSCLEPGI